MRQFYILCEKGHALRDNLTWTNYRELHKKIKSNEYERLDEKTKNKLIKREENEIQDFIKHPILIKNSYNYREISEKILKQLILEDISSILVYISQKFTLST